MKVAPISSILIAQNRQRREFDPAAMEELRASLEGPAGLMHPIVVRQTDAGLQLVAGERRLRAITDMHELGSMLRYDGEWVPAGHIPYVELGDLDEVDAFEAELDENIRRKDLTVAERAKATADMFRLKQMKATRDGTAQPTVADVAVEIRGRGDGSSRETTRRELIIAQNLDDPAVRKATSIDEAYKVIKKKGETKRREALATEVGRTFNSKRHRLLNVDALTWMVEEPDAQFDIVLTDPPYGMGADEFGDSGQGVAGEAHGYEDSYENWCLLMDGLVPEMARLTKAEAHAYIFCDLDRFHELRRRMAAAGWTVHRTPLIWHNLDGFRAPWPQHGPQRKYELILYARKGDRGVANVAGDVLTYRKDAGVGYAPQKPVGLLQELLRRSALPGDRVLDPCAGSGSTLVACHSLKLSCTALEKLPAVYGMAVERLQGLQDLEGV